jgi:hypothetical protein
MVEGLCSGPAVDQEFQTGRKRDARQAILEIPHVLRYAGTVGFRERVAVVVVGVSAGFKI